VTRLEIQQAEDIAPAFEILKGRAEALYVASDSLIDANGIRINNLAHKSSSQMARGRRRARTQEPNAWQLPRLLRPRRERPRCRRAAKQRDELAPFQLTEMHPIPSRAGSTPQDIGNGSRAIGEGDLGPQLAKGPAPQRPGPYAIRDYARARGLSTFLHQQGHRRS
jgi:hypothetical protein